MTEEKIVQFELKGTLTPYGRQLLEKLQAEKIKLKLEESETNG